MIHESCRTVLNNIKDCSSRYWLSIKSKCSRMMFQNSNYHGFGTTVVWILPKHFFKFNCLGGWSAMFVPKWPAQLAGRRNCSKDGGWRHYRIWYRSRVTSFDSTASNIKTVIQDGRLLVNAVFRTRKSETILKCAVQVSLESVNFIRMCDMFVSSRIQLGRRSDFLHF